MVFQTAAILSTGAWIMVCATAFTVLAWLYWPPYVGGVRVIAGNTGIVSMTCTTEFDGRPATITVPKRNGVSDEEWVAQARNTLKVMGRQ